MGKWWKQFWCDHVWKRDKKEDLIDTYQNSPGGMYVYHYNNWASYDTCLKCDKKRIKSHSKKTHTTSRKF